MKNYPHIISKICEEPWLITPEKHRAIQRLLDSRLNHGMPDMPDEEEAEDPESEPMQEGNAVVIPIFGIIGKRLSYFEKHFFGGYDLEDLSEALDVAEDTDSISEIILHFDSPGGLITGISEMAERIAGIQKKVTSFTDTCMCSAAYYLAAGSDQIICTHSSRVGSIGTYALYMDYSQQLAVEGIKVNAISSGKNKLLGAWFKPMTPEEQAILQAQCDKLNDAFKLHVRTFRDGIVEDSMEGLCYDGRDSVMNGLVDSLVNDADEVLPMR